MADKPYWMEWHALVTGWAVIITLCFGVPHELEIPCWADSGKLHGGWGAAGLLSMLGIGVLTAAWGVGREH